MPGRNAGLLEREAAGSWSLWIVKQCLGKGCCGLQRDRLRGCEGRDRGGKRLWRKARQPWKQGDTALSCIVGSAITTASLPPQTGISGWTVERLAHQMTEALNYGGRPHSVCPFKWLIHQSAKQDPSLGAPSMCLVRWTTEKDPKQGIPKCLNEQSYGERLAKEPFWLPAMRDLKKDSDKATTPASEAVCVPGHLAPPGSLQAKQLHHIHTFPSRAALGAKLQCMAHMQRWN